MAELTTDAEALSEAATNFDGIRSFFLFEDSASESGAGMQDTEKGVTGMFAAQPTAEDTEKESMETMKKAWKDASSTPEGKTPSAMETSDDAFDFKDLEATETGDTNFDRISGDLKGAIGQVDSTAGDMDMVYEAGIYEVGVYQTAADDAASSLGSSMGF